jgi:hypothetical protein
MSALAVALLVAATLAAPLLLRPAIGRTDLGVWHPAAVWLALTSVFFGLGSAALALDGRPGPAFMVAGAIIVFALTVAGSDRLARRRTEHDGGPAPGHDDPTEADPAPLRPVVVAALAILGIALIAPTLLRVGLPFLAGDITGARSELAGLSVQVLRVSVPAMALGLILWPRSAADTATATSRRRLGWLAFGVLVALEVVLASRYLVAEVLAVAFVGVGLAGWRLRARRLAAAGLIVLLAFGGIGILRAYDQAAGRELAFAFERTVNRVLLIQPRTLEALQAAIPADQPFFGGLTWLRRLGPVVGRPDIPNVGYWIYPRLFPGQEPPGYAAPGVIGEAWANFGAAGLGLFALLGLVAERLGAFLSRRRRATGDLVAGALLIVFLARTHALGVDGFAVLVVLTVAWRILAAGGLAGTWRAVREMLAWRD